MNGPNMVNLDVNDVHLVFNGASNLLKFFVRGGKMLFMVSARCDGANGPFDYAGGAMSYGMYSLQDPKRFPPDSPQSSIFGPWFVEVLQNQGRMNTMPAIYGIHGGGFGRPNYPPGPGGKSYKCIRLQNQDMELLGSKLQEQMGFGKHFTLSVYK